MADYTTVFGSLEHFEKGGVQVIDDDARAYAFSNVFEVCSNAAPYERVVVAINQIYVLEAVRAEGRSAWYACAHDEFALCMDQVVQVELIQLAEPVRPPDADGAIALECEPVGARMGRITLRRGHQALLPAGSAYRFSAEHPGVLIVQTCRGPLSVERWAQICQR